MTTKTKTLGLAVVIAATMTAVGASSADVRPPHVRAILWTNPGNIAARDLVHGSGGLRVPAPPYQFIEEDNGGSTPKFKVHDRTGTMWRVKLGPEAKSETAATRFVWAMGYFTDDDYLIRNFRVKGMPKLRRGSNFVDRHGTFAYARFERSPIGSKYSGSWHWTENPFYGTRELNGLRTLMAVLNNWDLKDANTTIYDFPHKRIYLVGDVGATFGYASYRIPTGKSNSKLYARSKLIRRTEDSTVDFQAPGYPPVLSPFFLPHIIYSMTGGRVRAIGRDIPIEHARWMGKMLSQLTPAQIRSAFQVAGYSPEEVERFTEALQNRIAQLSDL